MTQPTIRVLEPSEFHLLEPLIEPGAAAIDPDFGSVVAALDPSSGEILGFVALQLVLHAEPIVIREDHRGKGLWRDLAEFTDGYLQAMQVQAVYNQPTSPRSEHICEEMGYVKSDFPLYCKVYSPSPEILKAMHEVRGFKIE